MVEVPVLPPDFAVPSLAPTGRLPPKQFCARSPTTASRQFCAPVPRSDINTHTDAEVSHARERPGRWDEDSPRTLAKSNTSTSKKSQSAIDGGRLVSILEKATPKEVTEMFQASFQQGGKASKSATKASKLMNKRSVWAIAECEQFVSLIADTVPIGEKQWVDVAAQWSRIANENHYPPRSFEQLRQKYSDLKKANRKPTGTSSRTRISKLVLKAEESYTSPAVLVFQSLSSRPRSRMHHTTPRP